MDVGLIKQLTDANTQNIKELKAGAIGVGQAWQDVITDRSASVTYTNDTGRSIMVYFSAIMTGDWTYPTFFINDIEFYGPVAGDERNSVLMVTVPATNTYRLAGTSIESIGAWNELR